jgi:hypothetical protein
MVITDLQPADILKLEFLLSGHRFEHYVVLTVVRGQDSYCECVGWNLERQRIETCMSSNDNVIIGGRWTVFRDGENITLT